MLTPTKVLSLGTTHITTKLRLINEDSENLQIGRLVRDIRGGVKNKKWGIWRTNPCQEKIVTQIACKALHSEIDTQYRFCAWGYHVASHGRWLVGEGGGGTVADLRVGTCPPWGPIVFNFMQFSGKSCQNNKLALPFCVWRPIWEILDPPLERGMVSYVVDLTERQDQQRIAFCSLNGPSWFLCKNRLFQIIWCDGIASFCYSRL